MSRLLIQLLGVNERNFRSYVERLENVCLNPGVDIRLSADVITATRSKISSMEFDTNNVDPRQLYEQLVLRLRQHDVLIQKKLKLDYKTKSDTVAKRLALTVSKMSKQEKALCMSPAATRRVLKATPPSKTLRALKLRSLESVMKRFDPRMLYAVACLVESKSWRSQTHARMKRVSNKDIGWDSVEAVPMPSGWYEKLEDLFKGKGFFHVNRETGTILVMPVVRSDRPGSTVLAVGLLLQSAHRMAMESMPYKRRSLLRGGQSVLPEIAHGLQPRLAHIHGLLPTWPVVYQLFGSGFVKNDHQDVDLMFGDLDWESIESKMAKLVPEMSFWQGTHIQAYSYDGGVVSFHLVDVASSLVALRNLGNHHTAHFESSLWNELQLRYLQEETIKKSLMKQLMSSDELMVY